jgi:acetyl-CoA C-acetyltransferase
MARWLRAHPGAKGFIGANGGFLSKYSVGVYSTQPAEWRGWDSKPLQQEIDAWPAPALAPGYEGEANVETYTIDYSGAEPRGVVLGRTADQRRVVAMVDDASLVRRLIEEEPLGGKVTIAAGAEGRSVVSGFTTVG